MILYDLSSLIHRALHTSIKQMNPHKKDGKYITQEFISGTIFRVIEELLENYRLYRGKYHTMVICIDDHSIPYWRKSLYPDYKAQRKTQREESEINFKEVYKHIDLLIRVLNDYTPFKAIGVPGAEADDIIGVLTKKFSKAESILILSPDKDFKQLHKFGDVKQYSAITNEWVDKYIEVLSDTSNFDAPKYNIHHIKPVFTFKTEELNTRRKAEKIANKFSGNNIKLSIYNHILAHFYLWKIYDNNESK